MSYERITESPEFDGPVRDSHEYRYKLAAKYLKSGDDILDAACGTGYGREILFSVDFPIVYTGVDRENLCGNIVADLNTWRADMLPFDVLISFETLEHLSNWQNLIDIAHLAKRLIVLSTPIVPSVGSNEFHLQDFTKEQVTAALEHPEWELIHFEVQNEEYGIWVLQRRSPTV